MNFLRLRALFASTLCALGLAGCGLTSSPADGLTFKAPAGWQGSPGIMGYMQFWTSPGQSKEVLMLFKSPKPLDRKDVFSNAQMKDSEVESDQRITICGNQAADFLRATGKSSQNGQNDRMQMIMTDVAGTTYLAMYVYPVGTQPNGDAAAALRQLCAKP